MKVLSFIIPAYNCEQYLDKCITSFLDRQIIHKLDIIIVNDGSMDNTVSIAERYISQYPDSIRLISQENSGHGGALNTGCSAAVGKYLKVIDADDWVETSNLKQFIEALEEIDSDVVLTHHYTRDITTGESRKWMCYPNEFGIHHNLNDIISQWDNFARSITFHGITYRTEFYRTYNYKLSEKVFYEDHEYSTFPACFAQSILPMDIFIYNYRIGDVNQSVSAENRIKRLSNTEAVLRRFVTEFQNLPDDETIKEFVCLKTKILLISYLTTALISGMDKQEGKSQAKKVIDYFKSQIPRVYHLVKTQYIAFLVMNSLGIRKTALDVLLNSKVYHILKGTHGFN